MRSASLCASSAEKHFMICKSGKSADFPDLLFHGRGRKGKRHLQAFSGLNSLSQNCGFAGSLGEGAFGMAGKFQTNPQSVRACPLPLGGAVAQRLRGYKSAEPEKTVKRSSRRTGVNLQFFPVGAYFFRIVKGE